MAAGYRVGAEQAWEFILKKNVKKFKKAIDKRDYMC